MKRFVLIFALIAFSVSSSGFANDPPGAPAEGSKLITLEQDAALRAQEKALERTGRFVGGPAVTASVAAQRNHVPSRGPRVGEVISNGTAIVANEGTANAVVSRLAGRTGVVSKFFRGVALRAKPALKGLWGWAIMIGLMVVPAMIDGEEAVLPSFSLPYFNSFEHPRSLSGWAHYNPETDRLEEVKFNEEDREVLVEKRRIEHLARPNPNAHPDELELQGWTGEGKPWWVEPVKVTTNTVFRGSTILSQTKTVVDRRPATLWSIDATPGSMPGGAAYNNPGVTDPKMISRKSLNFNHPVTGTYQETLGAKTSVGSIISPTIDIKVSSKPFLLFWCNYDAGRTAEAAKPPRDDEFPDLSRGTDRRQITISSLTKQGEWKEVAYQSLTTSSDPDRDRFGPCTRPGEWHLHVCELEKAWQRIQIGFDFDAVDATDNAHRGWFIDDFQVIDLAMYGLSYQQMIQSVLEGQYGAGTAPSNLQPASSDQK